MSQSKLSKLILSVVTAVLITGTAVAHEMVPTYPEWGLSHMPDVSKTNVRLFNKRSDVEYYEIGLFDEDWKPIPFVTAYRVLKVEYLGHASIDVFIRSKDKARTKYICSRSKLRTKDNEVRTAISSRICSKFK